MKTSHIKYKYAPLACYALFLMVTFLTAPALAQEEILFIGNELGVGARAMSMGGAYIGVSDDYTSLYWNPAGLGQMRRMELNLGFSHNSLSNETTFFGNTESDETSFTRLNSLGFVLPIPTFQGSMVLGIGYNKMRDYNNSLKLSGFNTKSAAFPDLVLNEYETATGELYQTTIDDSLFQSETLVEEGSLNQWSIGGAIEVEKNFFLGASINFISGKDDYSLQFEEEDIYNLYNVFIQDYLMNDLDLLTYEQNISTKISATNLKLGSLYRFGKALRVGATISLPTKYTFREEWDYLQTEYYDGVAEPERWEDGGDFEYKIEEPYSFGVGASFNLLNFTVSGDIEYKDWSQAKFKSDPPIGDMTKAEANRLIKERLKDVTKLHLGAEMFIPLIKARVRAGYFKNPSPYKEAGAVVDKEFLSAGVSLMLDRQVMVDLGWIRGAWKDKTTDDLTQATTYEDRETNKFVGTLAIRF